MRKFYPLSKKNKSNAGENMPNQNKMMQSGWILLPH